MSIFKDLIEHNDRQQEKLKQQKLEEFNRPQFMIKDLYVAYDVSVSLNENVDNKYFTITNFAICTLNQDSNQYRVINDKSLPSNYVVRYAIPFCAEMQLYMQDRNLNMTSMLSLKQLQEIENAHSEQLFIRFN